VPGRGLDVVLVDAVFMWTSVCSAPWAQVYDGAIAATLPQDWRNLGVEAGGLDQANGMARPAQ
jgi:hypothetical protein